MNCFVKLCNVLSSGKFYVIKYFLIRGFPLKKAHEYSYLFCKSSIQWLYFIRLISLSLAYILLHVYLFKYLVCDSTLGLMITT